MSIAIIGGGAAGMFCALRIKDLSPHLSVAVYEKSQKLLSKVAISGGGRCNVTHSCFDPKKLAQNYPRGSKALIGPFSRFQPEDTVAWFQARGVTLKTEADGRMFPTSDSSQTIIDCFLEEAKNIGIEIVKGASVQSIKKEDNLFEIAFDNAPSIQANCIVLATGSNKGGFEIAKSLGHTIIEPVPSLFTFNVPTSPLLDLSGLSVKHATLQLEGCGDTFSGPLLITHWGFSGPAVLKLSSFAARKLAKLQYKETLLINWLGSEREERVRSILEQSRKNHPQKEAGSQSPFPEIAKNLWKRFLELAEIPHSLRLAELSNQKIALIAQLLTQSRYQIDGKTTYKEEFVTAGGIDCNEVNFKTMESKIVPNLYFAGEVLDIDGITGGFNFQNAWTTGFIAGTSIASK